MNTKSLAVGILAFLLCSLSRPCRVGFTLVAPEYFSRRWSPGIKILFGNFLNLFLYFFSFWLKTNVKCPYLTNFSEGSQLLPAGDEGAGAREAVTLTSHLHAVNNRLGLGKLIYDIYRTFMWLHQHQHKAGSGIKMIQIKLSLVNLIQRREPATHRWMVKRRFNYNNNVATLCPGNFIVIYPLSLLSSRK